MKEEQLGGFIVEKSNRNKANEISDVFSVTNVEGFIRSTDFFKKEVFSKNTSNYKIVSKDQFAYNPSRVNVGSIDYLKHESDVIISPLYVVFECQKSKIFPEYLKRFLKSPLGNLRIRTKTKGAVRDTLSFKSLSTIKFPLPSLSDQKRIAKVLSNCDLLIQKRKESINLLDELLKSTFREMFGSSLGNHKKFELIEIGNLATKIVDCPHSTPKYVDEVSEYPCIRTSEIKNGTIDWSSMRYISEDGYKKRVERLVPKQGDVVFAREGIVGDLAIIPPNVKISLGQRVMLFRLDENIMTPQYFWGLIKSDGIQHKIQGKTIGATVKRINIADLKKIKCPVAPFKDQQKYTVIYSKIESIKSQFILSLSELENLYNSISQRAFKGELDLSKIEVTDMEEKEPTKPETEPVGEPYQVGKATMQDNIVNIDEIIKNNFSDVSFSFQQLEEALQNTGVHVAYDKMKKFIFKSLEGESPLLEQVFEEIKSNEDNSKPDSKIMLKLKS
jgi:type I restriction enzyme S subunit